MDCFTLAAYMQRAPFKLDPAPCSSVQNQQSKTNTTSWYVLFLIVLCCCRCLRYLGRRVLRHQVGTIGLFPVNAPSFKGFVRSTRSRQGQDLDLGWWLQPAFFAAPCFSRLLHCMTDPAFLVVSLTPALINCTQPPASCDRGCLTYCLFMLQ